MNHQVNFLFGIGAEVVDETRINGFGRGTIYRQENEARGIFYAVKGTHGSWLAKEGALTLASDYKKPVLTEREQQEPA